MTLTDIFSKRSTPFTAEEACELLNLTPSEHKRLLHSNALRRSIFAFDDPLHRIVLHSFWDILECRILIDLMDAGMDLDAAAQTSSDVCDHFAEMETDNFVPIDWTTQADPADGVGRDGGPFLERMSHRHDALLTTALCLVARAADAGAAAPPPADASLTMWLDAADAPSSLRLTMGSPPPTSPGRMALPASA